MNGDCASPACLGAFDSAAIRRRGFQLANSTYGSLAVVVCATTLLIAATLKFYQLYTDPALGLIYGSRLLQTGLVEYEICIAGWLLCGLRAEWCRCVTLLTFFGFASYSLFHAVSGSESCGCFGDLQIHPWWTFFLDSAAVMLLWRWNPVSGYPKANPSRRVRAIHLTGTLVFAALFVSVPVVVVSAVKYTEQDLAYDGFLTGDSFIVLQPEKWVGKPFRLGKSVDIGKRLETGNWTLFLYHHDCAKCQSALTTNERQAHDLRTAGEEIALIEVPPFDIGGHSPWEFAEHGRLTGDREWLVATPVEIRLTDGQVTAVEFSEDVLIDAIEDNSPEPESR